MEQPHGHKSSDRSSMVNTLSVQWNGQRNDKHGQSPWFHKCVYKFWLSSGQGIFGEVRGVWGPRLCHPHPWREHTLILCLLNLGKWAENIKTFTWKQSFKKKHLKEWWSQRRENIKQTEQKHQSVGTWNQTLLWQGGWHCHCSPPPSPLKNPGLSKASPCSPQQMESQGMDLWDKNTLKGVVMTKDVCHWQGRNLWEISAPTNTHKATRENKSSQEPKTSLPWDELWGLDCSAWKQTQNSSEFHFPHPGGRTIAWNRIKSFYF